MNKNSPDIAFILNSLQGGGAERVTVTLANELASRGYQIEIVLMKKEGPYLDLISDRVSLADLETSPLLQAVRPLISYLRSTQPRYLCSQLMGDSIVALSATSLSRTQTKNVVGIHSRPSMEDLTGTAEKILPRLAKLLYPRADKIIAASEAVASDVEEFFEVDRPCVCYNPFDLETIRSRANEPVNHPFVGSDPLFIAVGRLSTTKNINTLIHAFSYFNEIRNARLLILGEGPQRDDLESLIDQIGIKKQVSMLGFVDNPYKYIRASDALVLSSISEGFGNVIVEAFACGTPVVSTDCGGPREILADGEYGLLVPVGNTKALADAMQTVVNNPPEVPSLQSRAERFSISTVVDEYERCIFK